jgi:hypothetical protein
VRRPQVQILELQVRARQVLALLVLKQNQLHQ